MANGKTAYKRNTQKQVCMSRWADYITSWLHLIWIILLATVRCVSPDCHLYLNFYFILFFILFGLCGALEFSEYNAAHLSGTPKMSYWWNWKKKKNTSASLQSIFTFFKVPSSEHFWHLVKLTNNILTFHKCVQTKMLQWVLISFATTHATSCSDYSRSC